MRTLLVPILIFLWLSSPFMVHGCDNSFDSLSISTSDAIVLNPISVDFSALSDNELTIEIESSFQTVGTNPYIEVDLEYSGVTVPTYLGKATVFVDVTYYQKDGGRAYFYGGYSNTIVTNPENHTYLIEYVIDLRDELSGVYSFLLLQNDSLSIEDVGFAGSFSASLTFSNSVDTIGDHRYARFRFICNGNMSSGTMSFTTPADCDLITATCGNQTMSKEVPNRVLTSFRVLPGQRLDSGIYVEWEFVIPEPWYRQAPYDWIISGVIGALVGTFIISPSAVLMWRFVNKRRQAQPADDTVEGEG